MLTSLSKGGAYIETSDVFEQGQPVRVEFKLESGPISVFANVTRIYEDSDARGQTKPVAVDVIFYEVDDVTDDRISQAVEQLWTRYLP